MFQFNVSIECFNSIFEVSNEYNGSSSFLGGHIPLNKTDFYNTIVLIFQIINQNEMKMRHSQSNSNKACRHIKIDPFLIQIEHHSHVL